MDFTTRTIVVIVAAVFFSLLSSPALLAATSAQLDYWPTHGWRTTTPEKQGMYSGLLVDMIRTIPPIDVDMGKKTIYRWELFSSINNI